MRVNAVRKRAEREQTVRCGGEREAEPDAGGGAVDGGDHGDRQLGELVQEAGHAAVHRLFDRVAILDQLAARREIGAGAEAASVAGEDHGARLLALAYGLELLHEHAEHLPRDRIHLLGSIEDQEQDVAVTLDQEIVSHR